MTQNEKNFFMKACLYFSLIVSAVAAADDKPKKNDKPIDVFTTKVSLSDIYDPVVLGGFVESEGTEISYSGVTGVVKAISLYEGSKVSKGRGVVLIQPTGNGYEYKTHRALASRAGLVGKIYVKPGQLVKAHEPLFSVVTLKDYYTTVEMTASDLKYIKIGDVALASFEGQEAGDGEAIATVRSIAAEADEKLGSFTVRFSLGCKDKGSDCLKNLRPKTFAELTIRQNHRRGILVKSNLLQKNDTSIIAMTEDNKAQWVTVKLGKNLGDKVEITEGLKEGMTIVASYSNEPQDNQLLKVITKEEAIANGSSVQPTKSATNTKKTSNSKKSKG
jgi:multidrug efflux pump subunit AcrA (membrane-fusion protein)